MARGAYHEYLTEDGQTLLNGWARDGLTDKQIANNIGINVATLYVWKNKYPEIDEALKKGKAIPDYEVENALYKRAIGYEYEERKEIQEVVDGQLKKKVEVTKKHMPADSTAMIFWLKNRQPDKWQNVASAVKDRNRVEMEKAQAEAELAKVEAQERSEDTKPVEIIIVDDLKDVDDDDRK